MPTSPTRRVVITGAGVITALGQDPATVWQAILAGASGVGPIRSLDASALPVRIAGEVIGFDAKKLLTRDERKSLKMMARPVQLGVNCAKLAFADSGVDRPKLDSTRFGIEMGSGLIPTELDDLAGAARISTNTAGIVRGGTLGAEGLREIQPLW